MVSDNITLIGATFTWVESESPNGPFNSKEKYLPIDHPDFPQYEEGYENIADSAGSRIDVYRCNKCGHVAPSTLGGIFDHLYKTHGIVF